jgi:hypothetical protein
MIKMIDALMKRMLTSCLSNVDQYFEGTGILEGYNISSSRAVKVVGVVLSIGGFARNGVTKLQCGGLWRLLKRFLGEYDTNILVPVWDEGTESEL